MNKQDFIEMMQKTQAPLMNMVEMIPDDNRRALDAAVRHWHH